MAEDIASLFGVQRPAIVKHIGNIYKDEELLQLVPFWNSLQKMVNYYICWI